MDCFQITGGVPLTGVVTASGSKNAGLPLMAASLLCSGQTRLLRTPRLRDTETMAQVLVSLGLECSWNGGTMEIQGGGGGGPIEASYQLVRRMRASVCVLGPLLAARGQAIVALPGGCVFGQRPIDLHLRAMEAFGAEIEVVHGAVYAKSPPSGLHPAEVDLLGPQGTTVLGTANAMMAAAGIDGRSILRNVACEPELLALAKFLVAAGASIEGLGGTDLEVIGTTTLKGVDYEVPSDRIEAGTLLLAGAITRGEVRVKDCQPSDNLALLESLTDCGVEVEQGPDWVGLRAVGDLRAKSVRTAPYPAFPTDLQAQWMAFSLTCEGRCQVIDTVYPERFMHVDELNRLGAGIRRQGAEAFLSGPILLSGAPVLASDLRASAALVLAGMAASGNTTVRRVYHLDRGYEQLEVKLQQLGARVKRCVDEQSP